MSTTVRFVRTVALALACLTLAQPAHAYLDPSTASMVISAIVGLLATLSLALKTFWYKIKSFFRKQQDDNPDADESEDF
ncbi:MAG: hypothetical protein OEW64_12275 [Gammaproteobacteria bacterium]|nr:hypothetical protein [Gammaproteobacteria bacterium]MDH5304856.1 hypothetical protein [Gammaproteobacteria bacterium]MDH5323193.1 hypothetical protein [Gammaproteobacteria bacterium]